MENSTGFYDSCFWPQGPYFVDTRLQYLFEKPLIAPNRKPTLYLTSIPKTNGLERQEKAQKHHGGLKKTQILRVKFRLCVLLASKFSCPEAFHVTIDLLKRHGHTRFGSTPEKWCFGFGRVTTTTFHLPGKCSELFERDSNFSHVFS